MQSELTRQTAGALQAAGPNAAGLTALVGPDAFVDEIIHVVAKRTSDTEYTTMERIHELGTRIIGAAGQSTNIELVVDRVKLGGNGPIMANALAALGTQVTGVGPFGEGGIHPAFSEMASRARIVSLGEPGHTDALEFDDGKLMLGKLEPLNNVTWERILERLGADETQRLFTTSNLVALVNWTMVPAMSDIWTKALTLLGDVVGTGGSGPRFFFDLADPEKRSDDAVSDACHLLSKFQQFGPTTLGLNEKEAFRVGATLGYTGQTVGRENVRAVTAHISKQLPIEGVVVHPRAYAVAASAGDITADVDGPFVENPLISTGAGDHFNAGYCFGKLIGLSDEEAVTAAVGTSGYYVRNAISPSFRQLAEFLAGQAGE